MTPINSTLNRLLFLSNNNINKNKLLNSKIHTSTLVESENNSNNSKDDKRIEIISGEVAEEEAKTAEKDQSKNINKYSSDNNSKIRSQSIRQKLTTFKNLNTFIEFDRKKTFKNNLNIYNKNSSFKELNKSIKIGKQAYRNENSIQTTEKESAAIKLAKLINKNDPEKAAKKLLEPVEQLIKNITKELGQKNDRFTNNIDNKKAFLDKLIESLIKEKENLDRSFSMR